MKRVLVTGASGNVGRHVVRSLMARGVEVLAAGAEGSVTPRAVEHRRLVRMFAVA